MLDAGSGGETLATDQLAGGEHVQIIKLSLGALDTSVLATPGAGNVDTGTLRVTLADDDKAVVALQLIDDAIFVDDTATHATGTTKLMGVGAVATPTDTAVAANDIGMLAMSLDRRLLVDADITASVALDVSAAALVVSITDTSFAVGDGNALGEGVLIQGDDGTDRKNINVDATTGDVQVDVTNTVTVDGSGVTQPVSGTVTANLSATDNAVLDSIVTNQSARSTGGCKMFTSVDLDQTEEDVTTGATTIYGIYAWNLTAARLL